MHVRAGASIEPPFQPSLPVLSPSGSFIFVPRHFLAKSLLSEPEAVYSIPRELVGATMNASTADLSWLPGDADGKQHGHNMGFTRKHHGRLPSIC